MQKFPVPRLETALARILTPPSALMPSANTPAAMIMLTTEIKISAIAFKITIMSSPNFLAFLCLANSTRKTKEMLTKFAVTTSSLIVKNTL